MKEKGPRSPGGRDSGFDPTRLPRLDSARRPVPEEQRTVDLWPGGVPARHAGDSGLEVSIELSVRDPGARISGEWDMPFAVDVEDLPRQTVGFRKRSFRVLSEGRLELGAPVEQCHYDLLSVLGRGGMGLVCLARNRALGRDVALKLVQDSTNKEKVDAFVREARITGMLQHPNVVPVYDLAMDDQGQVFYTMKRLSGVSWEDLLSPGRILDSDVRTRLEARKASMSPDDHLEILEKVCEAVAYAHSKGLIHRDLKPSNVMIGDFGEVLVGDWGLAMEFGNNNPYLKDPTLVPKLAGTPAYMAPEMAKGELARLGPETDVYLLGGILYRLLVGEPPHSVDGSVHAAVEQAASGACVAPIDICSSLDPNLSAIAVKALSPRMEDRYHDALEFKEAIRRYRSHAKSLKVSRSALKTLGRLIFLLGGAANDAFEAEPRGFETLEQELPLLEKNFGRAGRPLDDEQAVRAYALVGECIGSFRRALELWSGNEAARSGLERARQLAFLFAIRQGDLAVARHYLDEIESFLPLDEESLDRGNGSLRSERDESQVWASQMRRIFDRRMAYERERAARERRLKNVAMMSAVVSLVAMVLAVALLW